MLTVGMDFFQGRLKGSRFYGNLLQMAKSFLDF